MNGLKMTDKENRGTRILRTGKWPYYVAKIMYNCVLHQAATRRSF